MPKTKTLPLPRWLVQEIAAAKAALHRGSVYPDADTALGYDQGYLAALEKVAARVAPKGTDDVMRARVLIWDAINEYAAACGGDTGAAAVGNRRMDAVVAVERAIEALNHA